MLKTSKFYVFITLIFIIYSSFASKCSGHFMRLMHKLFVTIAPRPGDGWGIAEQMSQVFYFYIEFIPRQTWQCNVNILDYGGKLAWFYQLAVPAVQGSFPDNCPCE